MSEYFHTAENRHRHANLSFVDTLNEFRDNLTARFFASEWLQAVDFSKFAIVGGCILNAVCRTPFPDTDAQDINILYCGHDYSDFEESVKSMVSRLGMLQENPKETSISLVRVADGTFSITLPLSDVKIKVFKATPNETIDALSHSLHNLDMDITQVAFVGKFWSYGNLMFQVLPTVFLRCKNSCDSCFLSSDGNKIILVL